MSTARPSYDEHQANAMHGPCEVCGRIAFYTSRKPICDKCQRWAAAILNREGIMSCEVRQ